jgi:IS30 family transposase
LGQKVIKLTFNNGKELRRHGKIDEAMGPTINFERTFVNWERGNNENFNGLLILYVPKKRSLESIADEQIKMNENRLNNRRRNRLGFRTPAEVFQQSISHFALRPLIHQI